MKYFLSAVFLLAAATIYGMEKISFSGENPGNLNLYFHPSTNADHSKKPLLIVLHGCFQDANKISKQTGWNKLSDLYGFHVMYPEQKIINNGSACFNWFLNDDRSGNKGEVRSIYHFFTYIRSRYNIDENRVYIYGLSAGAAMSVCFMLNFPELIHTGIVCAGGAFDTGTNLLNASGKMRNPEEKNADELFKMARSLRPDYSGSYPYLITGHGRKDQVVDFKNVIHLIRQWTALHQADDTADSIAVNIKDVKGIEYNEYWNDSAKAVVKAYFFEELGHELAVFPGEEPERGGNIQAFTKNIQFHSTWQFALDLGLCK